MSKRKPRQPNLTEKLAATLLEYQRLLGAPLDREQAKRLTAYQIVKRFEFHHEVYRALQGGNHPTNLTPHLVSIHRDRTAKKDIPAIAKMKRRAAKVEKAGAEKKVEAFMVQHRPAAEALARELLRAPKPRPKRKMQSRGFQGSRSFSGKVTWKKDRKPKSPR